METERICKKCGKVVVVNALNINQRMFRTEEKKLIQVTFCKCENCENINVLQLDDESTMQDLRKLGTLIVRRAKNRGRYSRNLEADKAEGEKLNRRIEDRRKALTEAYRGKKLTERGGKIIIKSLDM